jgi:hypothetical protein
VTDQTDTVASGSTGDLFLLRDLIWCELCGAPMLAVTLSTGGRFYGCPYRECQRPLIDAPVVEQLVWHQFALLFEDTAAAVPSTLRRAALRRKLRRVRVGEDPTELWHEWLD